MYFSTSRALAVLELLQAHGLMRGEDIAARLEVDARTVRRYVLILRERGVPIEMRRGRHGGYSLAPGYRAPLALTREEALALTYGLLAAAPHARDRRAMQATQHARGDNPAAGGESSRALRKVARALPGPTRALIQGMEGAVTLATPVTPDLSGDEQTTPAQLEVAVHAIRARRRLRIRHRGQTDAETERAVDPYQVVHRYGRWYLVGYCHLRQGLRVFRLDHILDAAPLTETFTPQEVDALAEVERAIAQTPWRWEFQVVAALAPEEVVRRLAPTLATHEPHARGTLLRGFADDLDPLAYALAGLGCPLEIIAPPELRAAFRALAGRFGAIADAPVMAAATEPAPAS